MGGADDAARLVGEQHRHAVGGADHQADAGLGGDQAVAHGVEMPVDVVRRPLGTHHRHVVAVHLAELGQALQPEPGAKSAITSRWFSSIAAGSSPPAQARLRVS